MARKIRKDRTEFDPERISELRKLYRQLAQAKATATGFRIDWIMGRQRSKPLVAVRAEIWLEMWGLGYSTTEIGHVVDRDHSSVVRSNMIMRNTNSNAGYVLRARAAENRRMAIMAARAGKSAAAVKQALELADEARRTLEATRDAAVKARIAYANIQRAMRDSVLVGASLEVEATRLAGEREARMAEMSAVMVGLRGRERYDAVIDAMLLLDDEGAERMWADYCRSAFPNSEAANIANPPRRWVMRMQEAA